MTSVSFNNNIQRLRKIPRYCCLLFGTLFVDLFYFFSSGLRRRLSSPGLRQYYRSKSYPSYLSVGDAASFCAEDAAFYCSGKGVDIGAGSYPFGNSRAIDNSINENALSICEQDASLDYVFSSHCLEHLHPSDYKLFFEESYRVLKPKGIFYLYLPTTVARLWSPEVLPAHINIPLGRQIAQLATDVGFSIVDMSLLPDAYFSKRIVLIK